MYHVEVYNSSLNITTEQTALIFKFRKTYLPAVFWYYCPLLPVGPLSSIRCKKALGGGAVYMPFRAADPVVQGSTYGVKTWSVKWFRGGGISLSFRQSMTCAETSALCGSGFRAEVTSVEESARWFGVTPVPAAFFKAAFVLIGWGVVVSLGGHLVLRVGGVRIVRIIDFNPEGDGKGISVCVCFMQLTII